MKRLKSFILLAIGCSLLAGCKSTSTIVPPHEESFLGGTPVMVVNVDNEKEVPNFEFIGYERDPRAPNNHTSFPTLIGANFTQSRFGLYTYRPVYDGEGGPLVGYSKMSSSTGGVADNVLKNKETAKFSIWYWPFTVKNNPLIKESYYYDPQYKVTAIWYTTKEDRHDWASGYDNFFIPLDEFVLTEDYKILMEAEAYYNNK